jgi:hypothetical protein
MIAAQPFDRRVILVGGGLFPVLLAVSARATGSSATSCISSTAPGICS